MDSDLILLIVLIILSGVFSGAEIALTSLSPAKVRTMKEDKKMTSNAIVKLKNSPQKLLITILIGNNLVNILATVIATVWGMRFFGNNAIGYVTGILTFIILVFGEIVPKTFSQKYSESFSKFIAIPLLWLTYILFPIIWIFEKFIHFLMFLFKAKNPILSTSEEELLAMVDIGTEEGVFEEEEQELIENVLDFADTSVEEIMTIEKDMEILPVETSIKEAAKFFIEHTHSRIPVYKGDIDNIVGTINVHDILKLIYENNEIKTLADINHPNFITVPKTKSIKELFNEFNIRRKHIAIVVNELGQTIGLVTLEDILEEIVGDITDEQDQEEKTVRKLDNTTWEADGDATIEEINEELDIELEYPEHQTISLLILEELKRFPTQGEKITFENLELQINEMGKNKIEKIIITII